MGHIAMFRQFTLTTDGTTLVTHFNLKEMPEFSPRYNIAPNDRLATVSASMALPPREIKYLSWGLIFDEKAVQRKEDREATVREDNLPAPRFESLFRFKRCLILADGLFVWQREHDAPKYFVRSDRQPFALAGLRQHFSSGEDSFDTCAIITTNLIDDGVSDLAMPALVEPQDYDPWLSPMNTKVQRIKKLIRPLPFGAMESWEVGDHVKDISDKLAHCTEVRQQESDDKDPLPSQSG
jgi:putative SOS response-associated peptidase YedK